VTSIVRQECLYATLNYTLYNEGQKVTSSQVVDVESIRCRRKGRHSQDDDCDNRRISRKMKIWREKREVLIKDEVEVASTVRDV